MKPTTRPVSSKWATLVLLAASLALASCGRKGGLDLPPNGASLSGAVAPQVAEEPAKGNVFDPSYGTDRPPEAAPGRKRPFVLDRRLD